MIGPMNTDSQGLVAAQLEAASAALVATIPAEVSDYVDGIIITDGDIITHAANFDAHGVTRELITFTAATPPHIAGNLLSHDQQSGISGWAAHNGSVASVAGGADGGGAVRLTTATPGAQSYLVSDHTAVGSVAPGESRTASVRVYSPVAKVVQVVVWWTDAGGVFVNAVGGPLISIAAGVTTTLSLNAPNAPASSSRLRVTVVLAPDQVLGGDTLDFSVACLRTSPTIPGSSGVADTIPQGSTCIALVSATELKVTCDGGNPAGVGALVTPSHPGISRMVKTHASVKYSSAGPGTFIFEHIQGTRWSSASMYGYGSYAPVVTHAVASGSGAAYVNAMDYSTPSNGTEWYLSDITVIEETL